MSAGRIVIFAAGVLFLVGCAPAASVPAVTPDAASDAAPAPRAEGLYTSEQADRGEQVFGDVCAACHGVNEFRGQMFQLTWMAESVSGFYQHISTAMPQDRPGTLPSEQYAAIVAYVMRLNGLPAGSRELPADPATLAGYQWVQ